MTMASAARAFERSEEAISRLNPSTDRPWLPLRGGAALAGLGFVVSAACADLSTEPDQTPAAIILAPGVSTVLEHEVVPVQVTVVDRRGRAIDNIPPWAELNWASANPRVVVVDGGRLVAALPGESTVTASMAGLTETATVRVNPRSLKVDIGAVVVSQPGTGSGFLASGIETTIQAFLTADTINFFSPKVYATLTSGGTTVTTLELTRDAESIPQQLQVHDPRNAWTATIPAHLVQPGLGLSLVADPEGTFTHSPGSRDRYPDAGAFSLAIDQPAILMRLAGAYLTQSIQRFDGSIPIVADRAAFLRVFLVSDETNHLQPPVRATFYEGASVIHQVEIHNTSGSIPLSVDEGIPGRSWNVMIPGSVLRPGVSMVIEADPMGTVSLKAGSTTRIPEVGQMTLDVRPVPPLWLRMVPVTQSEMGSTGRIDSGNLAAYVQAAQSKFPLNQVNVDIRTPYVTATTATSMSSWTALLYEIQALRVAESSGRYYYGVVTHPGGNNIGGIGFIGGRAAVGYDHLALGPETFAHELGHNFNLRHAPCGGPSDADPQFPYLGGGIGHYGFDMTTGTIKLPSAEKDLMSYCTPEWISDYSYQRAMTYRHSWDWIDNGPDASGDALLVWGGVANGEMVLEPAFRLDMVPSVPTDSRGSYEIRGLDARGSVIFSYRFEPEEIDHADARSFAFAIPNEVAKADELVEIVLTGPEGETRQTRSAAPPPPATRLARPGIVRAEASWDAAASPVALVRDAGTGEVLSFARGGRIALPGRVVDVITSDGVRSTRRTIDLR